MIIIIWLFDFDYLFTTACRDASLRILWNSITQNHQNQIIGHALRSPKDMKYYRRVFSFFFHNETFIKERENETNNRSKRENKGSYKSLVSTPSLAKKRNTQIKPKLLGFRIHNLICQGVCLNIGAERLTCLKTTLDKERKKLISLMN